MSPYIQADPMPLCLPLLTLLMQVVVQDEFDATSNCTLFAPKLFPELNPGEDRIFEQLTYTTCLNGTAEEKSKPLTILLWDGGASWSKNSLQSGQEVKDCWKFYKNSRVRFLRQRGVRWPTVNSALTKANFKGQTWSFFRGQPLRRPHWKSLMGR